MASNIITLNVGGTIYTTSIATLTCYKESMLGKMFKLQDEDGRDLLSPSNKDEQGRFVIDRDGPMFRYVLNFLRESSLTLPEDFKELDILRREAEFYQIKPLIEAVDKVVSQAVDKICIKMASNIITLNVGGTIYTTSIATLTCYNESMLGKMFKLQDEDSGGQLSPSYKDEQGRFVIDRDGPMFRYVLNFLRGSSLTLPEDFKELDILRREAEFYQIEPLIEAVDKICIKMASNIITLNVGGTIYTTSTETLTRYPNTKLDKIFRENGEDSWRQLDPSNKDEHGRFVIDRDGPMFRYVLDFLRELSLNLPEDFKELGTLRREAGFYQIQPLIEAVDAFANKAFFKN